jgi:hypothetical protein
MATARNKLDGGIGNDQLTFGQRATTRCLAATTTTR